MYICMYGVYDDMHNNDPNSIHVTRFTRFSRWMPKILSTPKLNNHDNVNSHHRKYNNNDNHHNHNDNNNNGNLSNTTCLTQLFFKSGNECCKVW